MSLLITTDIPSALSSDRFELFCQGVLLSEEKSWRRGLYGNCRLWYFIFYLTTYVIQLKEDDPSLTFGYGCKVT